MSIDEKESGVVAVEFTSDAPVHSPPPKRTLRGVVLVPQPSDDPEDPLNWPLWRKLMTLAIVALASLICSAQALANQSGFFPQALLYHKTPVQISYSISASIAGFTTGPFVWVPLSHRIGRSSCIFWSLIGSALCAVWAAEMQGPNDYIPFVISRWIGGTFGSATVVVGAGTILEVFFLHQRGRAFVSYTIATLLGNVMAPTISGFIVENNDWPVQYWWTIGVQAVLVICAFLFLGETHYDAEDRGSHYRPRSWINGRIATFFPGSRVAPKDVRKRNSKFAAFLIAICPVTMLAGTFLLTSFGFAIAIATLSSIYLQTPVKLGGYGFTPLQNALFTFAAWVGLGAAFIYSANVNDRVPLWMCRRNGGVWKPEHRIWPLITLPCVFLPVALGLFGASLQYHLHYMVLALSIFLINFCEIALVPLIVNYTVESFTSHGPEVITVLFCYRNVLALTIPFFIEAWTAAVGVGWVFGMMAFFSLLSFTIPFLLVWQGEAIRELSFGRLRKAEDGVVVEEAPLRHGGEAT